MASFKELFWPSAGKQAPAEEKKQVSVEASKSFDDYLYLPLFSMTQELGWYGLSNHAALLYYKNIAPVSTAVDLIAVNACQVMPFIWDEDEYRKNGKFIEFLRNPNFRQDWAKFIKDIITHYAATGNAFLIASGADLEDPVSVEPISPHRVDWSQGYGQDALLTGKYSVTNGAGWQEDFSAKIKNGQLRWFNSAGNKELVHIAGPGVDATVSPMAIAPLASLFFEIEQYKASNKHNQSLLDRGATPGLIVEQPDGIMTQDQLSELKTELQKFHGGASNAGRTLILSNGLKAVTNFQLITNKDMDFRELRKDMVTTIYNRLRIPIPLISPDQMTLSNFDAARVALFDNAVLPMLGEVFAALQHAFGKRFGMSDNEKLTYDPDAIPALKERRLMEAERQAKLGANTINEIRSLTGFESIGAEGDVIMTSVQNVPLGQDQYTKPNRAKPADKAMNLAADNFAASLAEHLEKYASSNN